MLKILKSKVTYIVLLVVVAIVGMVATGHILSEVNSTHNGTVEEGTIPEKPKKDEVVIPTLNVPANVSVDKNQTANFEVVTTNLGEYVVMVSVKNTQIASVVIQGEKYVIYPKTCGTTEIFTEINTTPVLKKSTTLEVLDVVSDIDYSIKTTGGNSPEFFYVGNEYLLQISENANVANLPQITKSDNISNFEYVSKVGNILTYKFKIVASGQFSFKYSSKYFSKNITENAYVYPDNFTVNFSNSNSGNMLNLYIFNNDFLSQANDDNIFSSTTFNISTLPNSNDSVSYSITGDCVDVFNSTIIAKTSGTATITFKSDISLITKQYTITVEKVHPTSVCLNNQSYTVGEHISLSLKPNTQSPFSFAITPAYHYGNISIATSNVTIENSTITLLSNTEGCITITLDNSQILLVTITPQIDYTIKISPYNSDLSISNNILTCPLATQYLILQCEIYYGNTQHTTQDLTFTISAPTILQNTDLSNKVKNNLITLELLKLGTTTITFTSPTLPISLTLTISVCYGNIPPFSKTVLKIIKYIE